MSQTIFELPPSSGVTADRSCCQGKLQVPGAPRCRCQPYPFNQVAAGIETLDGIAFIARSNLDVACLILAGVHHRSVMSVTADDCPGPALPSASVELVPAAAVVASHQVQSTGYGGPSNKMLAMERKPCTYKSIEAICHARMTSCQTRA